MPTSRGDVGVGRLSTGEEDSAESRAPDLAAALLAATVSGGSEPLG